MTGHIRFTAWDAEHPATQSPFVIHEIIRQRIGFSGLLLTDDLDMEALDGSGDLSDVARAAVEGRVATLLLEADRQIPGRIDAATGALSFANLGDPEVDDLLDDLGEYVLRGGGEVVVVPVERMPTTTGLAASYRY